MYNDELIDLLYGEIVKLSKRRTDLVNDELEEQIRQLRNQLRSVQQDEAVLQLKGNHGI